MSTKSKYIGGNLTFYDSASFESLLPLAPVRYFDDFLSGAGGLATLPDVSSEENGLAWTKLIVGAGPPTIGVTADGANGVMELALTNDSQAQDAMIYHSDQRSFSLKQGCIFEARVKLSILPTTGVAVVFGMAGNHNLDKDTITEHAWFRAQASAAILAESDDTTNNNDDVATDVTVTTAQWKIYQIDFRTIADVRFFIDGASVATGTTFDMSNLTDAEAVMQPYFSLDKASGTGVGTMQIDYVGIWSNRS